MWISAFTVHKLETQLIQTASSPLVEIPPPGLIGPSDWFWISPRGCMDLNLVNWLSCFRSLWLLFYFWVCLSVLITSFSLSQVAYFPTFCVDFHTLISACLPVLRPFVAHSFLLLCNMLWTKAIEFIARWVGSEKVVSRAVPKIIKFFYENTKQVFVSERKKHKIKSSKA